MAEKPKTSDLYKLWGITPETVSGDTEGKTITLDIDDFSKKWGLSEATKPKEIKEKKTIEDQRSYPSKLNKQIISGMPIIGPLFNKGLAAAEAAFEPAINPIRAAIGKEPIPMAQSFGGRYEQRLAEIREQDKRFAQENPIASTAANVVGGTLATVPFGATSLGGRALGISGPSWGARLYQGAAGGAAIGGTDAALRGENPLTGAEVGGIVGAAAPTIGVAVQKGVTGAANYLFPRPGALRGTNSVARNWLTNAMEGETPASIAAARARMGPEGIFSDINPALTDIAGGVADIPGPGKAIVRETLRLRQATQRNRIEDAITDALGPRINLANVTRTEKAARKGAADPLYERFRSTRIHPTDELKELVPVLEQDGLFSAANKLMSLEGKPVQQNFFTGGDRKSWPTAESIDYVKQAIDGRIGEALRSGNNNVARVYGGLKRRLDNAIANHPDKGIARLWNEAREAWANPTAIMQAREAGQDVWKRSVRPDELGYELTDLSRPERLAFMQGARDSLGQMMDASVRGDTTVRNMLLAPANQDKLNWLATRHGYRPSNLTGRLEQEVTNSANYQNIVGGSQTTPKKERINALIAPEIPSYFQQIDISRPATLIPDALRPQTIFEGARAQRYANATQQVAPLLMTRNGPAMDDLISSIVAERNRQAAAQSLGSRLNTVATGAISGPGNSSSQNLLMRKTPDGYPYYVPAQ